MNLPPVPMTVDGAAVLHQMLSIRWPEWRALPESRRAEIAAEASAVLSEMETAADGQSGLFSMVGHKADVMLVHFRSAIDRLNEAELKLASLALWDYLELKTSYVSIVELGLYESSAKTYAKLAGEGLEPGTPAWDAAIEEVMAGHRRAMAPRLFPEIPDRKYACFYPMDRKRGESKNWYQVPMAERQRMMSEHGAIGRRYADVVRQIISGSIGLDDWEWGVDLFADDPGVFKKLIYEMRFDEVSAVYALFGTFFVGVRVKAAGLSELLSGKLPVRE